MIIDVKATRQAAAEPEPAQRYALKSMDRKSRKPLALGLMLAGLVVYLKSFLAGSGRAAENDGPEPAGAEEIEPEPLPQEQELGLAALPVPFSPPEGAAGDEPQGSGGRIVEEMPPARFMQVESLAMPPIEASISADARDWISSNPFGFDWFAANDNPPPDFRLPDAPPPQGPGETEPAGLVPDTTDAAPDTTDAAPDEAEDPAGEDDDEKAPNRAPRVSGPVHLLDLAGCAVLLIGLEDLLRNAYDPDGDVLSVENLTISHGTLVRADDGWLFQGGPRLEGEVTITYEVSDGALSVAQVAYLTVKRNAIAGSGDDDVLLGSMCADEIDGGAGDDNIDARRRRRRLRRRR